jgi:DNA-binding PadR family transcriptional regulator
MKISSDRKPSTGGWVILGLLLDAPRSGYELAAIAQRSVSQFWPVTKAHVYGELPRLERLGFVTGKDVPQKGAPDKRTYAVTKRGRTAFREWLAGSDLGEPLLRHPLLLQVFFGAHLPPSRLLDVVDDYRRRIVAAQENYAAILERAAERQSDSSDGNAIAMRRLAIRYALLRLEAEHLWLKEIEAVTHAQHRD